MKIKDRILLGLVSGLTASIPGRILNELEYKKGIIDHTYEQAASNVFVKQSQIKTPSGKMIGIVANQALAATAGVATTYTLSATGRDYAIVKGMGIGIVYWMLLRGLPPKLGLGLPPKKPVTPLLSLLDHLIFGATLGYLNSKLGHDSLFPDTEEHLLPSH
jgi:hypothetical protein